MPVKQGKAPARAGASLFWMFPPFPTVPVYPKAPLPGFTTVHPKWLISSFEVLSLASSRSEDLLILPQFPVLPAGLRKAGCELRQCTGVARSPVDAPLLLRFFEKGRAALGRDTWFRPLSSASRRLSGRGVIKCCSCFFDPSNGPCELLWISAGSGHNSIASRIAAKLVAQSAEPAFLTSSSITLVNLCLTAM